MTGLAVSSWARGIPDFVVGKPQLPELLGDMGFRDHGEENGNYNIMVTEGDIRIGV